MSEGIEVPLEKQEDNPIVMIIHLAKDGKISVNGPLQNKILCYGMIESARDAVNEFHAKQNASNIVKANGHGIMDFVKSRF